MPYGDAGGLQPEQYQAATAHILKLDGYPAGDTPIPATPLEIAHINLDRHPEGSEPKVMAPSAAPPASEDTNVAGEAH